jgi:NADPH-dependent 2,4-dienoyl-CoA reductase/sulfur reductase-like enzyme
MGGRLIVVGGVAAGMSAATKAQRTRKDLEIVVYEQSGFVAYGSCGFPYFIKGEIPLPRAVNTRGSYAPPSAIPGV